jgi:hypothetical protein
VIGYHTALHVRAAERTVYPRAAAANAWTRDGNAGTREGGFIALNGPRPMPS